MNLVTKWISSLARIVVAGSVMLATPQPAIADTFAFNTLDPALGNIGPIGGETRPQTSRWYGQEFTATTSGLLTAVNLGLAIDQNLFNCCVGATSLPVNVQIWSARAIPGLPYDVLDGPMLAQLSGVTTVQYAGTSSAGSDVPLTSLQSNGTALITAGTSYYLVVWLYAQNRSPGLTKYTEPGGHLGDPPLGGAGSYLIGDSALQMQVLVSPVPLPAAAWLLFSGLGGLVMFKRARSTR
jgi:hypothetical protein